MNSKISTILGSEEEYTEEPYEGEVVDPSELPQPINNDNLPDMGDIDMKAVQADKELQSIIVSAMEHHQQLVAESTDLEPRLKPRHLEIANQTLGIALDAVKTKMKNNHEQKKQRMKEAEFVTPNTSKEVTNNNLIIAGTISDILDKLDEK